MSSRLPTKTISKSWVYETSWTSRPSGSTWPRTGMAFGRSTQFSRRRRATGRATNSTYKNSTTSSPRETMAHWIWTIKSICKTWARSRRFTAQAPSSRKTVSTTTGSETTTNFTPWRMLRQLSTCRRTIATLSTRTDCLNRIRWFRRARWSRWRRSWVQLTTSMGIAIWLRIRTRRSIRTTRPSIWWM